MEEDERRGTRRSPLTPPPPLFLHPLSSVLHLRLLRLPPCSIRFHSIQLGIPLGDPVRQTFHAAVAQRRECFGRRQVSEHRRPTRLVEPRRPHARPERLHRLG